MENDLIIIGVGNVLFKDEGIGVYAARYFQENFNVAPSIDIIDGATLGFTLMSYFQDYKRVIIVDTVSIDDKPASIYRLPAEEMMGLGSYRQTAHEVEIVEMLEICSLLDKIAEVVIIGVVPEDIKSVEIGISQSLKSAFPTLIDTIKNELISYSYDIEEIKKTTLEEIISNITSQN